MSGDPTPRTVGWLLDVTEREVTSSHQVLGAARRGVPCNSRRWVPGLNKTAGKQTRTPKSKMTLRDKMSLFKLEVLRQAPYGLASA